MLTYLPKIVSNFRVDFEIDYGFFILLFLEFRFYKFFVKKKQNCALLAEIQTVFFKLINPKYYYFNFAFYLMIQKIHHWVLLQQVFLFFKGKDLKKVKD